MWHDKLVGFMCFISAAKLELVVGIAGSVNTYSATGEEPPPGKQIALIFAAESSDLAIGHGDHSLLLADEPLVVEYDSPVGDADEASTSPLAIIDSIERLSMENPVPYLVYLILLVEYDFLSC